MQHVTVLGSGTMGAGIAQVSAVSGYDVMLYDIDEAALARAQVSIFDSIDKGVARGKTAPDVAEAAKERLQFTIDLGTAAANADLIIEAVPEIMSLKKELLTQLDALAPESAILASNTSSLSISALAAVTNRPDRVIGLHFFNPAHIMKLVEVITADDTSPNTVAACEAYCQQLAKTTVRCSDTPAFIVNRVARPFYLEALRLLGENAASSAEIDKLMKSAGFRMGPFELIDLVGCDVNFAVTESVYNAFFQDPKYRPHVIQKRMVESGKLGRKSGQGFYKYDK